VPACRGGAPNADKVHLCRDAADRMALPDTDFFKRICAENEKDVPVLTENLVSDCFGIDECKEIAKAARSKKLLGLKLSTRSLRYLPSIGLETILPTFEESTVENLAILLDRPVSWPCAVHLCGAGTQCDLAGSGQPRSDNSKSPNE
jgi:hypothetical protein